jgi:hypothetical protein
MTTEHLGDEGFRWFVGVVEDRDDPLKLGRVRVRIINVHSEKKSRIDTNALPWASILNGPNSASNNKIGVSPTGIMVGSTVVGFFMDGRDGNNPVIMGTLAGIQGENAHDVTPEAREINSIQKSLLGNEPASAYNSKYPYNKVLRTERGHVIEIDDTPDSERIHVYHTSGTYVEIDQEGRMVTKVQGDDFEVVVKNKNVYVNGNVTMQVNGNMDVNVGGSYSVKAGGDMTLQAGGHMTLQAAKIDLN